jgi:hypothetical protein
VDQEGSIKITDPLAAAPGKTDPLEGLKMVLLQAALLVTTRVTVADWPLFRYMVSSRYSQGLASFLDSVMLATGLAELLPEDDPDCSYFSVRSDIDEAAPAPQPSRGLYQAIAGQLEALAEQAHKMAGQDDETILLRHLGEDSSRLCLSQYDQELTKRSDYTDPALLELIEHDLAYLLRKQSASVETTL